MGYGLEQCPVCGKIFEKPYPRSRTCGNKECARLYKNQWTKDRRHELNPDSTKTHGRYSGEVYENAPDKIKAIMAKYANGVKPEHIAEWINSTI